MSAGEQVVGMGERRAMVLRREGEGIPFVLLHGAGHAHRAWGEVAARLAPHPVVAPALPGRAGSDGPPCASVTEAAAWVEALLDALRVGEFMLAGHSLGGAIAIELALREKARSIRGLALVSTGARLRVHPAILDRARGACRGGPRVEHGLACGPNAAADVAPRVRGHAAHTPPETELADWLAANAFDRMADLGAIRARTIVLVGDADALTPPRYAHYLAERIPGAELLVATGSSHALPDEDPDFVASALVRLARD